MIDLHCHILPKVDDGAQSLDECFNLIKEAKKAGFKEIVVTPHYMPGRYELNKNQIGALVHTISRELPEEVNDIKLYQGNEIYISQDIDKFIENGEATSLNNGKYVLFELSLNSEPVGVKDIVYKLFALGLTPIIAHPERYFYVQKNPNMLLDLIEMGVLFQSNYASILGMYGENAKKTFVKLLKHNMVHLLSSDTHRTNSIYPKIPECISKIRKYVGEEKIRELTTITPNKILNNEEVQIETPIKIKKFGF